MKKFLSLVLVSIIFSCCTTTENGPDSTGAAVVIEKFVKDNLKSPSTADFPSLVGLVKQVDTKTYEVNSYVDSQNSFGAMLRTNFYCKVKYAGNDKWTCEELRFEE